VAKISGRFPDIGESFLIFRIYSPISMLDWKSHSCGMAIGPTTITIRSFGGAELLGASSQLTYTVFTKIQKIV
jgi:hypothetical protein